MKSKVLLNNFCFTKCSVYYIIDNKLDHSAYYTIDNKLDHSSEYQPDNFQDKLPKENHEEYGYPKQIKLMKSQTKMRYRRVIKLGIKVFGDNVLWL